MGPLKVEPTGSWCGGQNKIGPYSLAKMKETNHHNCCRLSFFLSSFAVGSAVPKGYESSGRSSSTVRLRLPMREALMNSVDGSDQMKKKKKRPRRSPAGMAIEHCLSRTPLVPIKFNRRSVATAVPFHVVQRVCQNLDTEGDGSHAANDAAFAANAHAPALFVDVFPSACESASLVLARSFISWAVSAKSVNRLPN